MTPSQSRTVRIFLSSTFRDFALERDLLVRERGQETISDFDSGRCRSLSLNAKKRAHSGSGAL